MADALTTHPTIDPAAERAALVSAVGEQGAERAIGVCATFNMMNRTLDGGGVPIPATFDPLAVELGFDPAHVHH